jgi:hypothetical protein
MCWHRLHVKVHFQVFDISAISAAPTRGFRHRKPSGSSDLRSIAANDHDVAPFSKQEI